MLDGTDYVWIDAVMITKSDGYKVLLKQLILLGNYVKYLKKNFKNFKVGT